MKLFICDLDQTLAHTPPRPANPLWRGGWWSARASLEPPHVPAIPGDDFWIGATVEACRVAIADPETYTVLMTGRLERFFKFRVNELLAQKGLTFDEVLLCDGTATELFKKAKLDAFLKTGKYSFIEIWEDRPDHLVSFEEVAKQNGILFKTVLVPKERE